MLKCVLLIAILFAIFLAGCESTPPRPVAPTNPASDADYARKVAELTTLDRQAEELFQAGRGDEAGALIEKGEPLADTLLKVTHPSLDATIAASDLDQLYGRMLFSNRRYGWARLQFQKNLARWKHWEPQTADTARRLQAARDAIAECDRQMEK